MVLQVFQNRDIPMAFYGATSRHGQRRAWQWIFSESPVTMCQTSENGQDM